MYVSGLHRNYGYFPLHFTIYEIYRLLNFWLNFVNFHNKNFQKQKVFSCTKYVRKKLQSAM